MRPGSRQRGNAAVELAILLPILVTVVFGAVDFGRLFRAYVAANSAAHEAASYAARFPNGAASTPGALQTIVAGESGGAITVGAGGNAVLAGPTVVNGDRVAVAQVSLTYTFNPVVPVPFNGSIPFTVQAAAPLSGTELVGTMVPSPTPTVAPTMTSTPTATNTPVATNTPTQTVTPSPSGTPTNTPTATRTPTATATVAMCAAPNYVGAKANTAQADWTARGFTGAFNRSSGSNFTISAQSVSPAQPNGATTWPCTTSITVS